jgi:hypothetical protein
MFRLGLISGEQFESTLLSTVETMDGLNESAKTVALLEIFKKLDINAAPFLANLKTAKEQGGFEKIHHVCEWLNCGWLEHYVLSEVGKISVKPPIDAKAASFNIVDVDQKSDEVWDKFQFDVAFRRGYQFFAISCTTSSIVDVCKEKLFEAYIRAKQLGGSEARVILVCFSNNPKIIAETFLSLIKDQKIAVFGRKDIKNLSKAIEKWIKELDAEVEKYRRSLQ